MPENLYQSPIEPANANQDQPQTVSSERAAYNIVTDTVIGPNVRWSDNKIQAIFIFATTLLGALIGAVLAAMIARWKLPWYAGAMIGAFAGLVIGFFASGIFFMIYRAARHIKGKHD